MKSVRLQLLATLAATAIAAGWLAYRGLPAGELFQDAVVNGDVGQTRRFLRWYFTWQDLPRLSHRGLWSLGWHATAWSYPEGLSPVQHAIVKGRVELVRLLMSSEGGLCSRDGAGSHPPMIEAVTLGNLDMMEAVYACGADVSARGVSSVTSLHLALYAESPRRGELVGWLLAHGANVDARGDVGNTPLHWASRMGDLDVVARLINGGADVNARNSEGVTPLGVCAGREHCRAVVDLLREHGATE